MEGVSEPDAETGVFLRQDLRHVIVSDEVSLMELREYPFSERILDCFKDNLREPCEDAVLPVPVSEKSVLVLARISHLHHPSRHEYERAHPGRVKQKRNEIP